MAVDKDYLQAQITALRMLADAAERAGDTEQAATYLRLRAHQMDRLRELEERLQPATKTTTVVPVMTDSHREALSNSRDLNDSSPMRAARKAGLPSLRAVAAALGQDPGNLSKIFRGKRPCPVPLAEAFEKLTKYPATRWKR